MHANNLRSPLAVELVAAVAIALPPTAGHLALPGPRVLSDAKIRLASSASGTSAGPIFAIECYSISAEAAGTTEVPLFPITEHMERFNQRYPTTDSPAVTTATGSAPGTW